MKRLTRVVIQAQASFFVDARSVDARMEVWVEGSDAVSVKRHGHRNRTEEYRNEKKRPAHRKLRKAMSKKSSAPSKSTQIHARARRRHRLRELPIHCYGGVESPVGK